MNSDLDKKKIKQMNKEQGLTPVDTKMKEAQAERNKYLIQKEPEARNIQKPLTQ